MLLIRQVASLPTKPGVYLFGDKTREILYVGKAKNLRARVGSYFRKKAGLETAKQKMVSKIKFLDTIVCDSEIEALVLEASLIKKHQPRYNVLLRDDKFYLFIKITTNESLPRVFPVRNIQKDGARYFGPYSSAAAVRNTLKVLRRIFPYADEKNSDNQQYFPHPLFSENEKILIDINETTYKENIARIIRFLTGEREQVISILKTGMKKAAQNKEYERAALFRDQLQAIERLEGSQKVYLPSKESFDVISVAKTKGKSAANVFSVRDGKLLNKNTFLLKHRANALNKDIIRQFVLQYYQVAQDVPKIIYLPEDLEDAPVLARWIGGGTNLVFKKPQRGKKRKLLEMGEINAKQMLNQEISVFEDEAQIKKALVDLQKALGLADQLKTSKVLKRIEIYDISNVQGHLATGSMVVFENGKPNKRQYKKFKIQTGDTPDDFRMMAEVLERRFSGRHTDWPIPDLIFIDGGRGQLNVAQRVIGKLKMDAPVASIAKQEELIFITGNKDPIRLPYDSPALFLVQRMRDEAHRFTITYHRQLRSKRQHRSILDEVPGIGPKTKKKLLNHFGSLQDIRVASDRDIADVIGKAKTKTLRDWL